jgi:hypothetical protein
VRKNHLLLDVAAGGALAFLLLLVFVLDRLLTPATADPSGGGSASRRGGTLLGDDRIADQVKALGDVERLEKLKVVRLTAKSRFAQATNVNDITLTWCWEPTIIIRFEEDNPQRVRALGRILDRSGPETRDRLLRDSKANFDFRADADLERRYDEEFRALVAARDYRSLLTTVLLLEDKQGYAVFNKRLALPIKPGRTTQMRNLCFALSISNLIPIRRHNFEIETAQPEMIKGVRCKQFLVKDRDGLKLRFYFDATTNLLTKISHMGHDPSGLPGSERQVLWEHYFSDYREAGGIKQWHRLEAHNDGRLFATLDVTDVQFFDDIQPELRPP